MKLQFIPYDYDAFDFHGKNYIKLIGRTSKGKKICIIDEYKPNFWAVLEPNLSETKIKKLQQKINKIKVKNADRETKVLKTELHNKKFLGKDVKAIQIFVENHKDAHSIASELGMKEIFKRREYDFPLISKYIKEKNILPSTWYDIEGEVLTREDFGGICERLDLELTIKADSITPSKKQLEIKPKILAFDIETSEIELGKGDVLMISLYGEKFKKVLTWKQCSKKQDYVECFKSEEQMLKAFVNCIKEQDPDLLVGYFSDGFDLPYLRAAAEENKIKLNLGIDDSQPKFSRGRMVSGKIAGIVHVDVFRFIQSAYSQYLQSETLSLNEVSSELLGEKKDDFDFGLLKNMKDNDWKNFFKYNLQDSALTYKLAEKIWPDLLEFTRIMKEPLYNVSRNSMSLNVENYIYHNLDKFNEIAQKRPTNEEIGKRRMRGKYEGAFVFQPQPGLYEDLVMFDFTSYWPSIIVTYNLSSTTLLEKKEKGSQEIEIKGEKIYFSKKQGFFPQMLKEIIEKRKKYKQEYNKDKNPLTKARSNAYKLLANASYGYQGFFGARYYCPEASAATTSISRDFIQKIIEKTNKQGYKVLYGDTDSFAFLLNKKSKAQTLDFLKQLNKDLPGIMELDLEDFYKRGLWVSKRTVKTGAKKKYALINEKGKIKIRGFETVRRDWCKLSRELQNDVLKLVLEKGDEKKALEIIRKTINDIKERKVPRNKLIIKTQLKKPINEYVAQGPHVIAAKKMEARGIPVSQGMLIEYFIAETPPGVKKKLVRDKVKLSDEKGEYNIEYYLDRQILPAVENILEVFGVNIREIIEGRRQMGLGEF